MKRTKEEIIAALKVIKEECAENTCRECPFGSKYGGCALYEPQDWNIANDDDVWRALR